MNLSTADLIRFQNVMRSAEVYRIYNEKNKQVGEHCRRLASGKNIANAEESSVNYFSSHKLQSTVRARAQIMANIADAKEMLTVGEDALNKVYEIIMTLNTEALRAANNSLNSEEFQVVQTRVDALIQEAENTLEDATFSGNQIFVESGATFEVFTGAVTQLALPGLDSDSLFGVSGAFTQTEGAENPFNGIDVGQNAMPVLGDTDGDNDLDAIVGNKSGDLFYFENTGSVEEASFVERTGAENPLDYASGIGRNAAPGLVDIDDDSDLDVFIGRKLGGAIDFHENEGNPSNPQYVQQTGADNPLDSYSGNQQSAPTFGDIDGDGDADLFIGDKIGNVSYFENTGSTSEPLFVERTGSENPLDAANGLDGYAAPTLVDIDNDGDLDAFIGRQTAGLIEYFENVGTGSSPAFVQRTGDDNPLDGVSTSGLQAPTFGDIDNDGDIDIFVGDQSGQIHFIRNDKEALDFTTVEGANAGIEVLTDAKTTVIDYLRELGKQQDMLSIQLAQSRMMLDTHEQARMRIEDLDIAREFTSLVRDQFLRENGLFVLIQTKINNKALATLTQEDSSEMIYRTGVTHTIVTPNVRSSDTPTGLFITDLLRDGHLVIDEEE